MLARALVSIGFLLVVYSGLVASAAFSNCQPFPTIPQEQYDRDSASVNDRTKRPLGFVYGSAADPTVSTNVNNPCVSLTNLTGKGVEVLVETFLPGKRVCFKSDDGKRACETGKINDCKEATKESMKYEFYCDPAYGCEGSVQFWYRLRLSEDDPDDWCTIYRQVEYPSSLLPMPSQLPTNKPQITSHAHQVIRPSLVFCLLILSSVILLLLQ